MGNKIRIGYLTRAFLGAHKLGYLLRKMCVLGDPRKNGTKLEWASPQSYRGPTRGLNCYATPLFSQVPRIWDDIRICNLTPAFSGAHK